MRRKLSRYHPHYIRSIVYMLQASEYNIRDFLRWHERVDDFRFVEKRKHLVYTPKAIGLFVCGWAAVALVCFSAFAAFSYFSVPWNYLVAAILLYEGPFLTALGILVVLFLTRLTQIPVEAAICARAKRKLAKHKAVKIAIAGSFGKTSMREIVKTVLGESKNVAAPGGSHNTPLAISRFIEKLSGDEEVIVFEFGEYYPGDVQLLCDLIQPDIGIITGINEAHLEKFKKLDATLSTVFELAEYLGEKPVYVNAENEPARMRSGVKHILYTRDGAGSWHVEDPKTGLAGTTFVLRGNGARIIIHSKLLGLHQVGPLACAADIATRLDLSPEDIQRGLSRTQPFEHRLEPRTDDAGVVTLDDSYNGSPDGVAAIIAFLASLKGHRRWYVTPGLVEMGSRVTEVHREIGAWLAEARIENVVLIRNSVTPHIEQGLEEANYAGTVHWFEDALQAYAAVPHMTVSGDVVLLQNDWPDQYA